MFAGRHWPPDACRGAFGGADTRCQRGKNWRDTDHRLIRPAQHQRVAARQAENPTAGTAIDHQDARLGKRPCTPGAFLEMAVAAIHNHIAGAAQAGQFAKNPPGNLACWNHHPDHPRWGKGGNQGGQFGP